MIVIYNKDKNNQKNIILDNNFCYLFHDLNGYELNFSNINLYLEKHLAKNSFIEKKNYISSLMKYLFFSK